MLVAADAQAVEGRDGQGDTKRLEVSAGQGQRHELRIDRRQHEIDLPRPAGREQSRHQLRRIAARHEQATILSHEIQARRAWIHVGHVNLVLGRETLPDADGGGAARAGHENAHV
jgi:hypothetical protein